jgi:pimeloyl-ACP methyl ester carboxylesterase
LRTRTAAEPQTLSATYERCRQLHDRHGRTYYLATLLSRWKRRHVHARYGFVRYADEIVDNLASTLDRAAPTLIVAGDRDRNYTPELFWETADRIPGARLRLYPGKGHASIATLRYRPAVREILGFLTADDTEP